MCSVNLSIGTFSGTTHIETIFSFSPDVAKHFIGNTLCRSDDFVTQLFKFCSFSRLETSFTNPEKKRNQTWRTWGKSSWWHISGYDGEHYFVSCPCGNSFPVTWCTTSRLPSCSYLSGHGGSWSFYRKRGIHSLALHCPDLIPLDLFFWGFIKEFFS
jgi:hypothetical protein